MRQRRTSRTLSCADSLDYAHRFVKYSIVGAEFVTSSCNTNVHFKERVLVLYSPWVRKLRVLIRSVRQLVISSIP